MITLLQNKCGICNLNLEKAEWSRNYTCWFYNCSSHFELVFSIKDDKMTFDHLWFRVEDLCGRIFFDKTNIFFLKTGEDFYLEKPVAINEILLLK